MARDRATGQFVEEPRRYSRALWLMMMHGDSGGTLMELAVSQISPTNASPINFKVTFIGPVTGFTNSDVVFTGSTAGGTLAAAVTGGPTIYNIAVTGMTTPGNVVVSIPAGAATVTATSAPSDASNTALVAWDNVAPSVTINQAAGQADPVGVSPILYTIVFSEPVINFINSDISFTGSTAGTSGGTGGLTASLSGGPTTWTLSVSGMSTNGDVIASIGAGVCTDTAGNNNTASTSTDNTVAWNGSLLSSSIVVTGVPASPTTSGTGVVFTGTITTTGSATGTIQFQDGGVNYQAAKTVSGNAASTTSDTGLSVATHTMTAIYSGDATHSGSTSSGYTHTVSAGGGGDITTGLIHHWPLTDGQTSGTITNDIGTPGGLNGGLNGGVTSVAGPNAAFATARALDGTDGTNINLASAPFDWNSGSFSIALWAWITNPGVAGPTSSQRFFLSDDTAGGTATKYANISNAAPGKLLFGTAGSGGAGGTYVITTPQVFPSTPAWVHVAVTNTGGGGGTGGTKIIYINGASVATTSGNTDASFDNGLSLMGAGSATDGKLTGKLSSIRVYSRALSAADVTALYNGGAGG